MEARYQTHLLIQKILEAPEKQEQAVPVTQEVRSTPAELKTIYQLKATDRPANVKDKLKKRAKKLLTKLKDTCDGAMSLHSITPDDLTQLIEDIDTCREAVVAWKRDVRATATEIVVKFNDLQQEIIALQTR